LGEHAADAAERFLRVRFPLVRDEYGWPPSDVEWLWCESVDAARYRVDNIPIYVRGVAVGDVIEVCHEEPGPTFARVVADSGHGTVRIIFLSDYDASVEPGQRLWQAILAAGCSFEGLSNSKLYAIDVPGREEFRNIRSTLEDGARSGIWDYDEAKVP
jgi:hypothetical protein